MKEKSLVIPFLAMTLLLGVSFYFRMNEVSFDTRSRAAKEPYPISNPKNPALTVDTKRVNVILSRDDAVGGLVYGKGFIITSNTADGWQIRYNEPTQGQGFYESSGGIIPGGTQVIRTYINVAKPDGKYSGSAVVQYQVGGVWYDGPTVSYSITLN